MNIYLYDTLERMGINHNCIRDSHVVVRAFNGPQRDTIGEIKLSVEIGSYTFNVSFQVLNITIEYNLLLGRTWIHMARAVPIHLTSAIQVYSERELGYSDSRT